MSVGDVTVDADKVEDAVLKDDATAGACPKLAGKPDFSAGAADKPDRISGRGVSASLPIEVAGDCAIGESP